ncbi:MAG TPA: filamentous hemagglutinin N-terminal domain-containing protein, partial [Myxococcales bacterium]|nr:filamentous hemagglutinin N-terminal domain-containing protein [Myxococcales bacterium]
MSRQKDRLKDRETPMSSPDPSEGARRNTKPRGRSFGLVLGATLALCGATAGSADNLLTGSTLTRDGSLGSEQVPLEIPGTGGVFDIGESHGSRPGGSNGINLLHSFGVFELASGDTANFHADYPTENIVVRVPYSVTIIEGSLDTETGPNTNGANLYWLSPRGVIFGNDATLDVGGSLAVSTADSLAFGADGETQTFEAHAEGQVPTLATARPEAFGFLGNASQRIVLNGSVLCGGNDIGCGGSPSRRRAVMGSITLEAGGIDLLEGAAIVASNQDVNLVATDSIELSGFDPVDDRGSSIRINNRNTQAGGNITLTADRIHLTDGAAVINLSQAGVESSGNIHLSATRGIRLDGSSEANMPIGSLILQNNFNDLVGISARLQRGSADILTVGSAVDAAGSTGAITLEAPVIELQDGAEVTTFAYGRASADITLLASDRLELSGRGRETPSDGSLASSSAVQSRNPGFGEAGARAGDIVVRAGDVVLRDGASFAVDTAGRGHAGAILIEADRLALLGESGLYSSSTATTALLEENGLFGAVPGQAGRIDVRAESVRLSGA